MDIESRTSSIARPAVFGEAEDRRDERSNHVERQRVISAARSGSCTDALLGAAFRYPLSSCRGLVR
jgi:hypothetical protein